MLHRWQANKNLRPQITSIYLKLIGTNICSGLWTNPSASADRCICADDTAAFILQLHLCLYCGCILNLLITSNIPRCRNSVRLQFLCSMSYWIGHYFFKVIILQQYKCRFHGCALRNSKVITSKHYSNWVAQSSIDHYSHPQVPR